MYVIVIITFIHFLQDFTIYFMFTISTELNKGSLLNEELLSCIINYTEKKEWVEYFVSLMDWLESKIKPLNQFNLHYSLKTSVRTWIPTYETDRFRILIDRIFTIFQRQNCNVIVLIGWKKNYFLRSKKNFNPKFSFI